ncbi:Phosphodiest-like protein [Alternaria alternata]|nr:Phosphodiest-like protein [Alternaria alternata]
MVHGHELLVHISAPVTRQNDQLYRSLANAYLDFEPARTHGDRSPQPGADVSSQDADTSRTSDPAVLNPGSSFDSNVDASFLSTGKDSYGSFPSGLSQIQDNDAPPSSRLARLEEIHQNWKAQVTTTPKSSAASRQRGAKDWYDGEEEECEDVDTAFIQDTQEARSALQSQMPDSFEMTDEDISADGIDERHVESDEYAGIFTQEAPLDGDEPTEQMTAITREEPLQSGPESSSPISWEDSDEAELVAENAAQEDPPSSDAPAEPIPVAIAEDTVPSRPAPLLKKPATVVDRRKSARLQGSKGAEIKSLGNPKARPELEFDSLLRRVKRRSSRLNDASKLAAPFKVPTTVASRRKSARLEKAGAAAAVKTHVPPTPPPAPTSTIARQQEALRLDEAPKPAVSTPQHEIKSLQEADCESDASIDLSTLPHSVLAPEPKIGITTPLTWPSQITPYLASLKTQHPSTFFQPLKKLHTPAPDTRGWWVASSDAGTDDRTLYDHTSDDEAYDGRPSGDLDERDRDILDSEDERERLLTREDGGKGILGRKGSGVKVGKWDKKSDTKGRRKSGNEEASALMYEMEEGIGASSTSFRSRRSSQSDEQRLLASELQRKTRRKSLYRRMAIYVSIIVLFVVLLAATYNLSTPKDVKGAVTLVSNGTSLFAPTTILISLDGFRADFLFRNLTPTLNQFVQEGISPKYMMPSFPSVTFPNHYTMATGMYPEAHGVVGNTFWDPELQQEFYYTDPDRSLQAHWWGGEPLWVTAEKQGVRTAVHMWPGSEAKILHQEIAYVDKYNGSEVLASKVDRIMSLLDTPGPRDVGAKANAPRPQLIAAYVPDVDGDGHRYGPNSTEIRKTIASADAMVGGILSGLQARNLTNIVNVIVVSDHGMATTDVTRLIQLEDLVDPKELEHTDGWPLYGLRPRDPDSLHRLYNQIKQRTKENPNVDVYLRDEDMPERYHFSRNKRIAPLWIVPKTGWAIVTRDEFDVEAGKKKGQVYHPRGLHGYDFEHPLMRAVFIARGPAFPHMPGSRMQPFQNIELYNIVCDTLGLTPAPNNGTLRLPLKPVGLHDDDEDAPGNENHTPEDPVPAYTIPSSSSSTDLASMDLNSLSSIAASASGMEDTSPSLHDPVVPARPTPADGSKDELKNKEGDKEASEGAEKEKESWWEWLTHKADGVKDWVDGFVHDHVPGGEEGQGKKGG